MGWGGVEGGGGEEYGVVTVGSEMLISPLAMLWGGYVLVFSSRTTLASYGIVSHASSYGLSPSYGMTAVEEEI